MTDETRETSLAAKIAKAALTIGGRLKADKKNIQQNYYYISADKILAEAGQALAEQGIAIIPKITASEVTLIEYAPDKTRWDARLTLVEVVTDGTETLEIPWAGWGSDYSVPDKAAYKAITSGDKYFRMKLLSIGEGNEDGEHENGEAEKPQQRQPAQRPTPQPTNGKAKTQPAATQTEEPPDWLEETAEEMGATVQPAGISLETAENITSSEGKRYGDMDNDELADKSAGIVMALRRKDISEERRDELKMRVDAIGVILKARAAKATN